MSLSRSLPNLAIRASPLAQSLPPSLSFSSLRQTNAHTQTQIQTQTHAQESGEGPRRDASSSSLLEKPQMSLSPLKPKARSTASLSLLAESAEMDTRNDDDATSAAFSPGVAAASASVSASADDASALLSKVQLPPSLNGAKSVASLVASLSASKKSKPVSKLRAGLLDQEEKRLQPSDFFTQIIDESSPMGRLKNPSAVFRIEKIDPNVYQPSCRRAKQHAPTDWSRVGVGGLGEIGKTHSGDDAGEFDPYKSTQSLHYPPLRYEPSQPVSRDLLSDAEREANHRAFKRSERYARKMANLEVTKTRLEYEALQKEIRAMRRQQSRIEDNIRYKTNVLLQDLQAFRTLPLQRMAKRQNIELADRMWSGSHDKGTVQLVPDDRDFRSTYNSSFDANVVKETIRINAQTINDRLHGTVSSTAEFSAP